MTPLFLSFSLSFLSLTPVAFSLLIHHLFQSNLHLSYLFFESVSSFHAQVGSSTFLQQHTPSFYFLLFSPTFLRIYQRPPPPSHSLPPSLFFSSPSASTPSPERVLVRFANCAHQRQQVGVDLKQTSKACSQKVCAFASVERKKKRGRGGGGERGVGGVEGVRERKASAQSSQSLLFSHTVPPVCMGANLPPLLLNGHFCGNVESLKAAPLHKLLHAGF